MKHGRLIDADALKAEIMKALGISEARYLLPSENAIWKIIDKMPTIEPERKKGEWIVTSEFEDCYYAKCNQCNTTQVFYFNKPLTNFCPNCGKPMVVK